jgi:thioester reductase-like protein
LSHAFFMTGFPGFIATRLLRKLAADHPAARFELLIHPSQLEKARRDAERLVQEGALQPESCTLLPGDITVEGLGIDADDHVRLQKTVTHVFHLAALYDLAVPQDVAYRINVLGTRHVNLYVQDLPALERYVYFSTAYVSGDRTGRILESELACGQSFKNHYESTKYEAEVDVQKIRRHVPLTIIRPGIVMGDSRTGETAKFDGPYFIMRFLDKLGALPIPYVGHGAAMINLVPVDYIIQSTAWLAHNEVGCDKVYHLTNPRPYTARQTYEWICEALLQKKPSWTLPASLVSASLSVPAFRRWVHVERETIDYFSCLADYDATEAVRDLADSGIRCAELPEFLGKAVKFYEEHRNDPDKKILVR